VNYRTTCPRCGSVFRLGEDQLKAADGWAQCGVCGENFDTHASLLQEGGSPLAGPIPTTDRRPATQAPAADAKEAQRPAVAAPDTPADAEPERLPSIILIDPDIPPPDDFGPLPDIPARKEPAPPAVDALPAEERASPAAQIEYAEAHAPDDAAEAASLLDEPGIEAGTDETTDDALAVDEADTLVDAFDTYPPRRRRTWPWALAALLLLTVLAGQLAYFLRDPLVTHVPETRPAMERACAHLGCTLSLPKNLALLQIVGSDLETESAEHLTLTLTLGNRAPYTQAWPVLVLTLTDQANRPLARRSFAPAEYLGDPKRVAAGIPPRSEQPLTLALAVRELKPMGFDLKLVY